MTDIRCTRITFFSRGDEEAFFLWAGAIPEILEIVGDGDEMVLRLRDDAVSDRGLRELIALLYRYDVPLRQLAALETDENRPWFRQTEKYWHTGVFGTE